MPGRPARLQFQRLSPARRRAVSPASGRRPQRGQRQRPAAPYRRANPGPQADRRQAGTGAGFFRGGQPPSGPDTNRRQPAAAYPAARAVAQGATSVFSDSACRRADYDASGAAANHSSSAHRVRAGHAVAGRIVRQAATAMMPMRRLLHRRVRRSGSTRCVRSSGGWIEATQLGGLFTSQSVCGRPWARRVPDAQRRRARVPTTYVRPDAPRPRCGHADNRRSRFHPRPRAAVKNVSASPGCRRSTCVACRGVAQDQNLTTRRGLQRCRAKNAGHGQSATNI